MLIFCSSNSFIPLKVNGMVKVLYYNILSIFIIHKLFSFSFSFVGIMMQFSVCLTTQFHISWLAVLLQTLVRIHFFKIKGLRRTCFYCISVKMLFLHKIKPELLKEMHHKIRIWLDNLKLFLIKTKYEENMFL